MKKALFIIGISAIISCNVGVDTENDKDSASRFDTTLEKVDDKLEEWGDSAKEKYKDAKEGIKDRLDRDSTRTN
jgi:ElaB/YqjD/DUF883 family membrane-anchored ribosome-binding protein